MKLHSLLFTLFTLLLSFGQLFSKDDDQQKNNIPSQPQDQIPIADRELISLIARVMRQHMQDHNLTQPQVFTPVEVAIRPIDPDAELDSDTDDSDLD